jgi:hypothetical protein
MAANSHLPYTVVYHHSKLLSLFPPDTKQWLRLPTTPSPQPPPTPALCGACFSCATLKCFGCANVQYCFAQCQHHDLPHHSSLSQTSLNFQQRLTPKHYCAI